MAVDAHYIKEHLEKSGADEKRLLAFGTEAQKAADEWKDIEPLSWLACRVWAGPSYSSLFVTSRESPPTGDYPYATEATFTFWKDGLKAEDTGQA